MKVSNKERSQKKSFLLHLEKKIVKKLTQTKEIVSPDKRFTEFDFPDTYGTTGTDTGTSSHLN